MAEHLFLRMQVDASHAAAVAVNAEGQMLARPERVPLEIAARMAADKQVTVLLPPGECMSCVVRIPSASPGRLRQMVPYALEDELAGDIDALHFAVGARNDQDLLAVTVIARERLETCLAVLGAARIKANRICSEADAVPDTPGLVTLFVEEHQIMGRRPGAAPFAFAELGLSELWQLLERERDDDEDLRRVVLFIDPETRRAREAEIEDWRGAVDDLDIKELADGCLPRLATNLVHESGTNLLQGDYATQANLAALARPWRAAAGLLLTLAALVVLGKAAVVLKLSGDVERLTERIAMVCAESYSSPELNACRLEMLRRLDGAGQPRARGGPGFLAAQAAIAEAAGDALRMQQLSYSDGVMRLVFLAPNVPYVDAFSQAVMQSGEFQVRDQSTTAEPNGVETRLSIVAQDR